VNAIDHAVVREKLEIISAHVAQYTVNLMNAGLSETSALYLASSLQDVLFRVEMTDVIVGGMENGQAAEKTN